MDKKDWDKTSAKNQRRIDRAGSIFTNRDRAGDFKTKKKKRNFVGRDIFTRQKGRGFINTTTNFQVRWTPAKLILITAIVGIPYIGFIVFVYNMGLPIVAGILIAVMFILLGLGWFIRWMDKNL
jgi:hypothetical protein